MADHRQLGSNVVPHPHQRRIEPLVVAVASQLGEPAPIEWIVDGMIPRGDVTLFAGPEKVGKSFAMIMLQIAAARGEPWLGRPTIKCASIADYSEDSTDRISERVRRILPEEEDRIDLEESVLWMDDSQDPVIYQTKPWIPIGEPTEKWAQILYKCREYHAELLILDNVGTVTVNLQIGQVRPFLRWLRGEAKQSGMAIILLVHPPKDRSSPIAGPADWTRAARWAFSMERPRRKGAEDVAWWEDDGERVIVSAAANYLPHDDPMRRHGIPIKWEDGVLVTREVLQSRLPLSQYDRAALDAKVWELLSKNIRRGHEIVSDPHAQKSFAKRMKDKPGWKDFSPTELEGVVERLIDDGRLVVASGLLRLPG